MGLPNPSVAFCLLGDITRNSRALRQIESLGRSGFSVYGLGFTKSTPHSSSFGDASIKLLPYPSATGPRLFLKAHQALKSELEELTPSHFHASDLYSLPASAAAAAKNNAILTYDARELYPHVESLRTSLFKRIAWRMIEKHLVRQCDKIFTVSPGIAQIMASSYQITPPLVIYNAPDLIAQRPSPLVLRELLNDPNDLIVLHNGQIRPGRGCEHLAQAIEHTNDVSLVFLGDGPAKQAIIDHSEERDYRHKLYFVDAVPPNEVISVTKQASIGATVLQDSCLNHRLALPNKLFEYIAAGVPVLASNLPEIASIINQYEVGAIVNPDDPRQISQILNKLEKNRSLLDKWRANTQLAAETFSWQKASEAFSSAFLSLHSTS